MPTRSLGGLLLALLGACASPGESDLAALMARPTRTFEGAIGATRSEPAGTFRIELPDVYQLDSGRADDGLSSHGFGARDTFLPSFSVRRVVRSDEIERPLMEPRGARVERGERDGVRWRTEVRATNVAITTHVDTARDTAIGPIFCSGSVDTPERDPIEHWILARCATLRVSAQ